MNTTLTKPQIELRGIKYYAALSEETQAYSATIYVDGVKFATVDNSGKGGPDSVRPIAGNYSQIRELDARIAATVPPVVCKYFPEGLKQDLETVCHGLLESYLQERDFKKHLKKLCLLLPDGSIVNYPAKCAVTPANIARAKERNAGAVCLNELPEAEALALMIKHLCPEA